MKQSTLIILLCLIIFSCKKDAEDIQNDLCKGIICNNGGTCVNGDCNCPPQWTGTDCSQQKTPTNLVLKSIHVNKFPPTDANGAGWDFSDGPDMYIVISSGSTVLYTSPSYLNVTTANAIFNINYSLPDVTAIYQISIYDYDDLSADDYMGGIQGVIYSSTNGFPTTLDFTCPTCPVGYSISLGYTW